MLTVRPGDGKDYPAVLRLQSACPEAAQWPVGDYSNFSIMLALFETQPVGFCAWRQTTPEETELLNLAVAPHARRRGVATALLLALREIARGDIFLEVAEPNTAATALYTRLGWEPVGVRKGYYQKGSLNAIVMKKGSW